MRYTVLNMIKTFVKGTISLISVIFPSALVFAQPGGSTITAVIDNPLDSQYSTFPLFIDAVVTVAVQVLFPFVVLAIIYSGFLFVKAQGNETELKEAKKVLWYSIVGAFVLLGALGFSQIIQTTIESVTAI